MSFEQKPKLKLSPATHRLLSQGRVILGSTSPRRREILKNQLGFTDLSVFPSGFAEDLDKRLYAPFEYVIATATHKVLDVYQAEVDSDRPPSIVIAADTIVVANGQILEKPRGIDHHIQMLKTLRDAKVPHKVFTAVACIVPFEEPVSPGYAMESHLEETAVYFKHDITDEEIAAYAASGEAKDAAGGYKIQEEGKKFVDRIEGDYFNVVGLPVDSTVKLIEKTVKASLNSDDHSDSDDEY
ncbi:dTTP/UTP pyrophosphatase [Trichomonascus vanleenenianus]|uniref:nucleotide diphosphatase n=1 Tax=Trichomonascus vanleenenianus TaxID=2268995 RepID=UPI003EC9E82F